MNKTFLGIAIALVLALAALFFLRNQDDPDSAQQPDRLFAVKDEADIQRIFIADLQGRSLNLNRQPDNSWLINDSLNASPSIMGEVIKTLQTLNIEYVPNKETSEEILKAMSSTALKVEVYNRADEKIRNILIGPATPRSSSSYMLVEGYNQPYAIRRGLTKGVLRPLFDLRSIDSWRDRNFVAYQPNEIQSVELRYPASPGESFRLVRVGDSLRLDALSELVGLKKQKLDQRRLESYFEGFSKIPLESRVGAGSTRDSIVTMVPMAQIIVQMRSGVADTLELQPSLQLNEYGAPDASFPFSSYWVERGNKELVTVQDHQINQVLRTYNSFFE